MGMEVVFGISQDGSSIHCDGADHRLYYEGRDFDVFLSSNARQTVYIVVEDPEECDMLVRFTSRDFVNMDRVDLDRYIREKLRRLKE